MSKSSETLKLQSLEPLFPKTKVPGKNSLEPLFPKRGSIQNSFQTRCLQSYNALLNKLETKEVDIEPSESKIPIGPTPIINLPPAPKLCLLSAQTRGIVQKRSFQEKIPKTEGPKTEGPKILIPRDSLHSDLEQDCITKIPIRKKDCRISDLSGNLIPYLKFRENIEHIIFYDPENSGLFFGYSKLQLYEEFQRCNSKLYFTLEFQTSKESLEFYIPMSQITRVLEYSHPVYQIVKASFSMHLYQLIPIELE